MPNKAEKFKRKTEPEDVAKTYKASRAVQLEAMAVILPAQSELWGRVKALCEKQGLQPMLISHYYAFACELSRLIGKYKGQTLMREAEALQIKFSQKGLDPKVLSLVAHELGVPLDPTIEVTVTNFPTEYPLPSSQVSDLKNIANFPSEYPLPSSQVSDLKNVNANVTNFPSEYPLPSSQVSDLKNIYVLREGSYVPFSVTLAAAGSQTIHTPSSGKKAKVLGFYVKCTADVDWEVRFKTSGQIICGLPFKGAVLLNGIGLETPLGGTDEQIEVYASGAATVKGWLIIKEV
jgi:hypothetical protein